MGEIQSRVDRGNNEYLAKGFISSENDIQELEEDLKFKIYVPSEDMKDSIESSIKE